MFGKDRECTICKISRFSSALILFFLTAFVAVEGRILLAITFLFLAILTTLLGFNLIDQNNFNNLQKRLKKVLSK